jgi:hypothetical protein
MLTIRYQLNGWIIVHFQLRKSRCDANIRKFLLLDGRFSDFYITCMTIEFIYSQHGKREVSKDE